MKVGDVMTYPVVTVGPDTRFRRLVETLMIHDISGVPVEDAGRIVGVVTESDLLAKEAYPPGSDQRRAWLAAFLKGETERIKKAGALTAKELMSSPAVCVSPEESLHTATRIMIEKRIKRLPVVQNGTLVGMISRQDALAVFARLDDELRAEIEGMLRRAWYVPPDHRITVSVEGGVVLLEGAVLFESDARIAGDLTARIDGVLQVVNELEYIRPDQEAAPVGREAPPELR